MNCVFCNRYVGGYRCKNENVLEKGREQIMGAIPDDYIISPIQIQEMNLKNPTKKCGEYSPDIDFLVYTIKNFFEGNSPEIGTE